MRLFFSKMAENNFEELNRETTINDAIRILANHGNKNSAKLATNQKIIFDRQRIQEAAISNLVSIDEKLVKDFQQLSERVSKIEDDKAQIKNLKSAAVFCSVSHVPDEQADYLLDCGHGLCQSCMKNDLVKHCPRCRGNKNLNRKIFR